MPFYISIRSNKYNGYESRGAVPQIIADNYGNPPKELVDAAFAGGNGFYEVRMDGTLGPKLAAVPDPVLTVREQKLAQAHTLIRGYARDFILGNGTPTNAQRNNALDALVAITILESEAD